MKVAMVTVSAITHGLARGFQVSWNESVAAAAKRGVLLGVHGGDHAGFSAHAAAD
jgi:hypothetical protein